MLSQTQAPVARAVLATIALTVLVAASASRVLGTPCAWNDASCFTSYANAHVHLGNCSLTDAECLAAQSRAAIDVSAAAATRAFEKAEARLDTIRADNFTNLVSQLSRMAENATADLQRAIGCEVSDIDCVGAAAQGAANDAVRAFEKRIGCRVSDAECLQSRAATVARDAGQEAQGAASDAVRAFEKMIGCSVSDAECLQTRAATLARDAGDEASSAVITSIGCGDAENLERCLLRRAQELSTALALVVSVTAIATGR